MTAGARVLVTGASGAGSTTLAGALARRWCCRHLDSDDFYWTHRDGPHAYRQKVAPAERARRLQAAVADDARFVLSGSVMGWGDDIEGVFDLVVFVYTATPVRLKRLAARDRRRRGCVDPEFLDWAAHYDRGGRPGRNLVCHARWLAARSCAVVCVRGEMPPMALIAAVEAARGEKN